MFYGNGEENGLPSSAVSLPKKGKIKLYFKSTSFMGASEITVSRDICFILNIFSDPHTGQAMVIRSMGIIEQNMS